MKNMHVIYVPGLGDAHVAAQRLAVRTWRLWGVEAEVCQMHWDDAEAWERKLHRLLARIDELVAEGKTLALVGSSAGASAVMNAYALRSSQVVGCVLITGKINRADAIGESYRRKNPAFVQSAYACEQSVAGLNEATRKRILSRVGVFDGVVPRRDSYIAGARNQTAPTFGHAFTIGAQIVLGAPSFLHFLENLAA